MAAPAPSTTFLHLRDGWTLWVPGHTAASEAEKKYPIHFLPVVTPAELARSFYLFDFPVHIVKDHHHTSPGLNYAHGRTVTEIVAAIGEFRNACAQDSKYLLERCYKPNQPPPARTSVTATSTSAVPPFAVGANGGLLFSPESGAPTSTIHNSNAYGSYSAGGNSFLTPYQQPPQQAPSNYGGANSFMQPPPAPSAPYMNYTNTNNNSNYYGGNSYNTANSNGYHYGNNNAYPQPPQQQAPYERRIPQGPNTVSEPEPIDKDPTLDIPKEVYDTYTNPRQPVVCASMPGQHITVWLREHPVPTKRTENNHQYVFSRDGVILMTRAKGEDVADSKPVELLPKQVCMHFLLHHYCTRPNCYHAHHTGAQLRELIAARHVELKRLTKKERQQRIEELLARDKEGQAKAEEERLARQKEKTASILQLDESGAPPPPSPPQQQAEPRENHNRKEAKAETVTAATTAAPAAAATTNNNNNHTKPVLTLDDIGVCDDDEGSNSSSSSSSSSSRSGSKASSSASSSSSSASSKASSRKASPARAEAVEDDVREAEEKEKKEEEEEKEEEAPRAPTPPPPAPPTPEKEEEEHEEEEEEEEEQEEQEEQVVEEKRGRKPKAKPAAAKAKKPAPKKRGRAPSAKKSKSAPKKTKN